MKDTDRLNHLRIASPCPADWEKMKGDERVRFCDLCNLNVYNLAQLTRNEAVSLVAKTGGRICARVYRRADGTVITKDCPVGLRAIRQRTARFAGAVFATLMSLSSVVFGQKPSMMDKFSPRPTVTIDREPGDWAAETCVLSDTTLDPSGAIVAGASISIIDRKTKGSTNTKSNGDGQFRVSGLPSATYDLVIESPGFQKLTLEAITLTAKETVRLEVLLEIGRAQLGGVMVLEPLIKTTRKPVINEGMILRRRFQ